MRAKPAEISRNPTRTLLVIAGEFPPLKTIGRIRTVKFVEHLRAHGWKFNTLKPGDKVVAHVRPLREGRVGGYLVSLTKDGAPIGDGSTSSATIQGYK